MSQTSQTDVCATRQDFEIILVQHGPRPQKIAGHEEIAVREHQAPQTRLGERVFAVSIIGNTQEPQSYKIRPPLRSADRRPRRALPALVARENRTEFTVVLTAGGILRC